MCCGVQVEGDGCEEKWMVGKIAEKEGELRLVLDTRTLSEGACCDRSCVGFVAIIGAAWDAPLAGPSHSHPHESESPGNPSSRGWPPRWHCR